MIFLSIRYIISIGRKQRNCLGIVETVATDYKIDNTTMLVFALNLEIHSGSQIL